ncbi:hypothetical protein [Telmatospirillum siberiense]|uniref:OmpA-like domain-containing protein n=1 Tax=Telmatospirillum siberiense TaxID=382514 RepID=A0A2N3Q0B2_9PROT|nr:hypothetical protein [Telmatospirillum siberiense]PKU26051.1 hypothetical protein CWS72_02625 [Telmatospirillum siberiense]
MFVSVQPKPHSIFSFVFGFALLPFAALAADQQQHCPVPSAVNDHVVCRKGCDPNADKQYLEKLAKDIQKAKAPVCLLALVDPRDRGYSKKLAIKRVLWVRDTLVENGVLLNTIAVELRPLQADAQKAGLQSVDVILGH